MFSLKDKLQPIVLSILSSLFLFLSFPKSDLWFLAWMGLLPLFFVIDGKRPLISFLLSYLAGFLFFITAIYWLIHVTLLGYVLLASYLAIYFGVFGLCVSLFHKKNSLLKLFLFPSIWVILEFLRGHLLTGFGWAFLGYTQYKILPLIQLADITGVYGLSFLIVMVNLVIFLMLRNHKSEENFTALAITIFILIISLGYGFLKLNHNANSQKIKISLIQANIPEEIKWDKASYQAMLDKHIKLSKAAKQDNPEIIIWPETAFPGFLGESQELLNEPASLSKDLKAHLLFGAISSKDYAIFNSAVLLSSQGKILKIYHKLHLVPFGEYVPFRNLFSFLPQLAVLGDFTAGKEYTVFSLENGKDKKFSTLICFEDTIPELSRQFVNRGARLLVNITNDAWFKDTSAPYQHLQASVLRAVENRTPIVRSANSGISAFIEASGRISGAVCNSQNKATFIAGFKTREMNLRNSLSFYSRFGDIFVLFCAGILCLSVFNLRKRDV